MRYKKSVYSVFDDLLFQDLFHSGEENIPLQNMIIGQFDFLWKTFKGELLGPCYINTTT